MKNRVFKFASWMDGLKRNRKTLLFLIILDLIMAVGSTIVDWPWLTSVKWYVMPFTPICSLYPLTLAIWFSLYYFKKKIPSWYTNFIFIGIVSYGIMAWIYYPAYISWDGIQFWLVGNIFWVTAYAIQSLIIVSELRRPPAYQYALIIAYFAFKDYSDRYLGSFIDILRPEFPEWMKSYIWTAIILIHVSVITLTAKIPSRSGKNEELKPEYQPAAD